MLFRHDNKVAIRCTGRSFKAYFGKFHTVSREGFYWCPNSGGESSPKDEDSDGDSTGDRDLYWYPKNEGCSPTLVKARTGIRRLIQIFHRRVKTWVIKAVTGIQRIGTPPRDKRPWFHKKAIERPWCYVFLRLCPTIIFSVMDNLCKNESHFKVSARSFVLIKFATLAMATKSMGVQILEAKVWEWEIEKVNFLSCKISGWKTWSDRSRRLTTKVRQSGILPRKP